jgi:hypothetical protein
VDCFVQQRDVDIGVNVNPIILYTEGRSVIMVRVFNEATGRFEECSACEQKRLERLAAQQGMSAQATFYPQRVPRTQFDKSYVSGRITSPFDK